MSESFEEKVSDLVVELTRQRDEALAQVMQMQIHANNYLSESHVWRQMAIQLAEDILLDGNASSRLIVKASKVQKAFDCVK